MGPVLAAKIAKFHNPGTLFSIHSGLSDAHNKIPGACMFIVMLIKFLCSIYKAKYIELDLRII
jgi:hypothetical protein